MSSELELLKQHITELEAENAERVELKRRIAETLRMTEEERTRRDAENVKLKATIEESGADDTSLPKDKETDAFLNEVHKKKVSNEIRQRNRERKAERKKLQIQESLPIHPEEKMSQDLNSATHPCNSASSEEKICSELDSNIDEASQHLALLCDKAFDAEDGANRANQEEILCWCLYAKDFRSQLNGIIENSDEIIEEQGDSPANASQDISSEKIPEVLHSVSNHNSSGEKSGLPISILPDDPEEKRRHIIGLVLECFPSLSLSDSSER
ncbi:5307_t:CDS:2, partial [Acaulospora morrowiae]